MTTKQINNRIAKYEKEMQELVTAHNAKVEELNQVMQENRNRFQQLTGRIEELKELRGSEEAIAA